VENGNSTKDLILNAAKRLFSAGGFSDTRISEISGMVGVSDSTVYEHFENKEDILFAIPQEYTQQLIEINRRHLRGLRGNDIKLRKLTWNYLEFLVDNKEYATLLLFELRPNRDFYETLNYKLIREFTRPYREAIIEGQKEGVFRPELSPSLILNLVFGTIDLILITWLLENNPSDPLVFFDAFFDLLEPGIGSLRPDSKKTNFKCGSEGFFTKWLCEDAYPGYSKVGGNCRRYHIQIFLKQGRDPVQPTCRKYKNTPFNSKRTPEWPKGHRS